MAISKNTKKKYNSSNSAYKENSEVTGLRNQLKGTPINAPSYTNSYLNDMTTIYNRIKNNQPFSYDPANDAAFRRYADEYNALSGLAIATNQAQAQDLTGGYGSTYAPEVASQGLARMREGVENAMPAFLLNAQDVYAANNDLLNSQYQAAATGRDAELDNYARMADAYADRYALAQQAYSDARDLDYDRYSNNRDYWNDRYQLELSATNADKERKQQNKQNEREYKLKSYDTYNTLASRKCADYQDAKNNKGMKAYLDGLVKAGKLTKYMADNLYKQYKYVAPAKSSGGGGGGRRSGNGGNGNRNGNGGNRNGGRRQNESWKPTQQQILALGYGDISDKRLQQLINSGDVILDIKNKTIKRAFPKQTGKGFKTNDKRITNKPNATRLTQGDLNILGRLRKK